MEAFDDTLRENSETIGIENVNLKLISDNDNLHENCENNATYKKVAPISKNQCTDIDSCFLRKREQVTGLDYPKALSIDSAIKLVRALVIFTQTVNSSNIFKNPNPTKTLGHRIFSQEV